MGIVLGQLGVLQSPLWAQQEAGRVIQAQFNTGERQWHMLLWVSSCGIIEGHYGAGHILEHRIRGTYRQGDGLEVRIGGRVFGDTLYLDLHNHTRIIGTIGGRLLGCVLDAAVGDGHITGWMTNHGIHREQFDVKMMDMEPAVALMMGGIACYHSYFVYHDPLWL